MTSLDSPLRTIATPGVDDLHVVPTDPSCPAATEILHEYFTDIITRWDATTATPAFIAEVMAGAPSDNLIGESGIFVIAYRGDEPVGCGGMRYLDSELGELTRIYTRSCARGLGVAARVIGELELRARASGRARLRLDTREDLVEAQRLYARLGFTPIARFNDDPFSHRWFGKELAD
ncbi:GNAT family N-acetyltransferase [Mycetocola spongiae]|uniref:GNAT family N-acetyltransferase n=1 Tax=Mycetocola spongiae TaxID=2859226 RepID=UPI001CF3D2EF|nr:GNAT family N-acetyltransferase [Mycetocola spongiae]UCR88034.1 GNAT family N-acetyltransferase [Mycetocola spongiae]